MSRPTKGWACTVVFRRGCSMEREYALPTECRLTGEVVRDYGAGPGSVYRHKVAVRLYYPGPTSRIGNDSPYGRSVVELFPLDDVRPASKRATVFLATVRLGAGSC